LKIRTKLLGPDHVETGRSERTLAEVYAMAGELDRAQVAFELALRTLTYAGVLKAELAELRGDMARVALQRGDRKTASELTRLALPDLAVSVRADFQLWCRQQRLCG